MQIATITTTRQPGSPVVSFVKYHLGVGVRHMFLFYEGPRDAALEEVSTLAQVTLVPADDELRREWQTLQSFVKVERFLDREVMARQIVNAESGVRRAREMGMDWILHLDADELVFTPEVSLREQFANAERAKATELVFLNHEAVPESEETRDYFRDVTLFKANPATVHDRASALPFIAYTTGKAAARLSEEPLPWGVHRFRSTRSQHRSLRSRRGVILHYPSCGFSRFILKYQMLGRFGDKWFDRVSIPDNMAFHSRARDLVQTGDMAAAYALYSEFVMLGRLDLHTKANLLSRGFLHRIAGPAGMLANPARCHA